MNDWYVYLLHCADGTLYAGITTDLERRLDEHNGVAGAQRGARYTRPRRPVRLAWSEACANRAEASRREAEIRRLGRAQKLAMIRTTKYL
jgi:putative endonuclease